MSRSFRIVACFALLAVLATPGDAGPPNVVLILTDDLDVASTRVLTKTQRLVRDPGMDLRAHFATTPLCCPSRATLLTGLYAHNHGVLRNAGPFGGFRRFQKLGHEGRTLAVALHAQGYRTGLFGKYLNHYSGTYVPPGWSNWAAIEGGNAYDGFGYWLNVDGRLVAFGKAVDDFATDVLAREAQRFLEESAVEHRPFFLYLAPVAPHIPATPAPRHWGLFGGVLADRGGSFDEADVRDKPTSVQRLDRLSPTVVKAIDSLHRNRLESLLAVDDAVATIVATLDRLGLLGDTYVFFTSDNGFHLGQHRLRPGKGTLYEEDVHVPLWVRGPGVPAQSSSDELTTMADLPVTIAALAGATMTGHPDGRTLEPLLGGGTPPRWRQVVLLETFGTEENARHVELSGASVRGRRFKLSRLRRGELEAYDLDRDPLELENVAGCLRAADRGALLGLLDQLIACKGTCVELEETPLPTPRLCGAEAHRYAAAGPSGSCHRMPVSMLVSSMVTSRHERGSQDHRRSARGAAGARPSGERRELDCHRAPGAPTDRRRRGVQEPASPARQGSLLTVGRDPPRRPLLTPRARSDDRCRHQQLDRVLQRRARRGRGAPRPSLGRGAAHPASAGADRAPQ